MLDTGKSKNTMNPTDYTYFVVEQFVNEVMDFSSQYGSDESISYTAHNIVGKPTKFPSYGDFSQTFVMRDYGPWWRQCPSGAIFRTPLPCPKNHSRGSNFIDVKFDIAVYPFRIHVYETYNPGGVFSIWAGDSCGGWKLLWRKQEQSHTPVVNQPRQFCPPIQPTDFPTKLLRLEFDSAELSYYTEIDAVCLLGTLDPISQSAKAVAMLPKNLDQYPVLSKIVSMKLHILPHTRQCINACVEQLSPPSLKMFTAQQLNQRQPIKDNGFFDSLPREVILKIFSFLDIESLVQVSATSSLLRDVSRDPWLYSNIDLRQIFHCVNNHTLAWLIQLVDKTTHVDLAWCGNYGSVSPSTLSSFIKSVAPRLEFINLDNCHIATGRVLSDLASFCHNLTHLSLGNCHLLTPQDYHPLTYFSNLVSLNLYRSSLQQSTVISILYNNPGLEHLSLAACNNINGDEVCQILSARQPRLKTLDLWRCSTLTGRGVTLLAQGCHLLEDLDLGWCLNVQASSGAILQLTESCSNLKKLFLTAHRQTGDRELAALAKLVNLEQLDILGNRNVSFAAVRNLIESLHNTLKMLDISFCNQLEESNIAELVQLHQNISVKWSFIDLS